MKATLSKKNRKGNAANTGGTPKTTSTANKLVAVVMSFVMLFYGLPAQALAVQLNGQNAESSQVVSQAPGTADNAAPGQGGAGLTGSAGALTAAGVQAAGGSLTADDASGDLSEPDQPADADAMDASQASPASDEPLSFTATTDNGVRVRAAAPAGTFPAGTTMQATAVDDETARAIAEQAVAEDQEVKGAKAVDITFRNAEGAEIEPAGNAGVHVVLTLADPLDGDDITVAHQSGDGTVEQVEDVKWATAKQAVFVGDAFSVYAIVATNEGLRPKTYTYQFVYPDNSTKEQIVKAGDDLYEPSTPVFEAGSTNRFEGWYYEGDDNHELLVFTPIGNGSGSVMPIGDIPANYADSNDVIRILAKTSACHYITFYDDTNYRQGGTPNVYQIVAVDMNGSSDPTFNLNDIKLSPQNSNEKFLGWSTVVGPSGLDNPSHKVISDADDGTVDGKVTVTLNENKTYYPVLSTAWMVTFDKNSGSDAATYWPPIMVEQGNSLQFALNNSDNPIYSKNPERPGFEFDSWNTKADGSGDTKDPNTFIPLGDTKLYAQWGPVDSVKVEVNYWRQRVGDNKNATDEQKTYDFMGKATTPIDAVYDDDTDKWYASLREEDVNKRTDDRDSADVSNKHYNFCHVNTTKSSCGGVSGAPVAVASDGTAVFNVYYDRDLIEYDFTAAFQQYMVSKNISSAEWTTDDSTIVPATEYGNWKEGAITDPTYTLTSHPTTRKQAGSRERTATATQTRTGYQIISGDANEAGQYGIYTGLYGQTFAQAGYSDGWPETISYERVTETRIVSWAYQTQNGERTGEGHWVKNGLGLTNYSYVFDGPYTDWRVTSTSAIQATVPTSGLTVISSSYVPAGGGSAGTDTVLSWATSWNGDSWSATFTDKFDPYFGTVFTQANTGQGTYPLAHLKQGLDGEYKIDRNMYTSNNFNIGAKYYGFTPAYTNRFNDYKSLWYQGDVAHQIQWNRTNYRTGYDWRGNEITQSLNSTSPYYKTTKAEIYHARNKNTITFHFNNGDPDYTINNVFFEMPLNDSRLPGPWPANPVLEGYSFEGWYLDETCTEERVDTDNLGNYKMPNAPLHLYANLVKDHYAVHVVPNQQEIEGIGYSSSTYFILTHGEQLDTNVQTARLTGVDESGYELLGWYVDGGSRLWVAGDTVERDDCASTFNASDSPNPSHESYDGIPMITLVAKYRTQANVTVEYDANGGTGAPTDERIYVSNAEIIAPEAPDASPVGKTFVGWADRLNHVYKPGEIIELSRGLVTDDSGSNYKVVLKAIYTSEVPTASITYIANNGTNATVVTDQYAFNESTTIAAKPDAFTKAGYRFMGWSMAPQEFFDDATLANAAVDFKPGDLAGVENMNATIVSDENSPHFGTFTNELYAVWAKEYTVTYVITSSIGGENAKELSREPDNEAYVSGEAVAVKPAPDQSAPPTGYIHTTFSGWQKDGVAAGESFSMPLEDVTITGTWNPIGYSVKFNANNGTEDSNVQTGFKYDIEKSLSTNSFTYGDYVFLGWSKNQKPASISNSSEDAEYADGGNVLNLTSTDDEEVQLYAVWKIPHAHQWSFTGDNSDTLTATCENADGNHAGSTYVAVTLAADSVTYGNALSATINDEAKDAFQAATGATIGDVAYFESNGTTPVTAQAPVVGSYIAKVTITEANGTTTHVIQKTIQVSKANRTAPEQPSASATAYNSITVSNAASGAVYVVKDARGVEVATATASEDGELVISGSAIVGNTAYKVVAYFPENDNYLQSSDSNEGSVTTPAHKLEKPNEFTTTSTATTISVTNPEAGVTYMISGGDLTSSREITATAGGEVKFDGLTPDTEYTIIAVRKAADNTETDSDERAASPTPKTEAHVHDYTGFTLSQDGKMLTAQCAGEGYTASCDRTLTISAQNATYAANTTVEATLAGTDDEAFKKADGNTVTASDIVYYKKNGNDWVALEGEAKPSNAGEYKAEVAVATGQDATTRISCTFTIGKADVNAPAAPTAVANAVNSASDTASVTVQSSVATSESTMAQEYIVLPVKSEGTYSDEEIAAAFETAKTNGGVQDGNGSDLTFTKDGEGADLKPGTDYIVYTRVAETDNTNASPAASTAATTKAYVAITGSTTVGSTLSASTNAPEGSTYQWYRVDDQGNATAISGATDSTYQLVEGDLGSTIKVVVKNPTGNEVGDATTSSAISNHAHKWSYDVDAEDASKLVATCANTDDGHDGDTAVELSLSVAGKSYDGTAPTVTLSADSFNAQTEHNVNIADIVYAGTGDTVYPGEGGNANVAPVNAGTYKATLTVEGKTIQVEFTITPKVLNGEDVPTIALAEGSSDSYVYDGTAKTPKYVVKDSGTTLTEGEDYVITYTNNTNASGEETPATAIITFMGNYEGTNPITQTFTIVKRAITVKPKPQTIEYGSSIENTTNDYTVTLSDEGASGEALVAGHVIVVMLSTDNVNATNSGTITATVESIKNGEEDVSVNYYVITETGDLTITPKDSTPFDEASYKAPSGVGDITYDAKPHALVTAGNPDGGTMMYRVVRVEGSGESVTETPVTEWVAGPNVPEQTNAGTYKVYYYVANNENYTKCGSENNPLGSVTTVIKKATPKVTAPTANTLTYAVDQNGDGVEQQLVTAGSTTGGTLKYCVSENNTPPTTSDEGWKDNAADIMKVEQGTYYVYYYVEGDDNYNGTEIAEHVAVTIGPLAMCEDPENPQVGDYRAVVVPSEASNDFTGSENKPTSVTVKLQQCTSVEGETPTWTDVKTLTEMSDYTLLYSPEPVTNVDDYSITAELQGNYSGNASADYEIKKVDNEIAVTVADSNNWTYGDAAHAVTYSGTLSGENTDGTVAYYQKGEGDEWTSIGSSQPVDAGDYKVVVTVAGTGNYDEAKGEAEFTIKPKVLTGDELDKVALTISEANATHEYDGTEWVPTTVTVTYDGREVPYTLEYPDKTKNAGVGYQITVKLTGNYEGTTKENAGTYSITARPIVVANITAENKPYDGTVNATLDVSGATFNGIVNGDELALDAEAAVGTFADANVGDDKTVAITGLVLTGESADNYVLADASQKTAQADITKAQANAPAEVPTAATGPEGENLVYTGEPQALVSDGSVDGGTFKYYVSEERLTQEQLDDISPEAWKAAADATATDAKPNATEDADAAYYVYYYVAGDANHEDGAKLPEQVVEATIAMFTPDAPKKVEATSTTIATANDVEVAIDVSIAVTDPAQEGATYEYSLDGKHYQASPEFTEDADGNPLEPGVTYDVYARVAGTDNTHPSAAAHAKVITDVAVALTGKPAVGEVLTANVTPASGDEPYTFEWRRAETDDEGHPILDEQGNQKYTVVKESSGEGANTYEPTLGDVGDNIYVVVKSGDKPVGKSGQTSPVTNHDHVFAYAADGATVTATCTVAEPECKLPDNKVILTLSVPADATYNGGPHHAKLDADELDEVDALQEFNSATGLSVSESSIKYYRLTKDDAGETVKAPLADGQKPTDAGDYLAEITVEGATASANFSIAPIVVALDWKNTELTYNGDEQAPVATAQGLVAGDECTVTVSGAQTNAGGYTATASALSNPNYALPDKAEQVFTIDPAPAKFDANNLPEQFKPYVPEGANPQYNGTEQQLVNAPKVTNLEGSELDGYNAIQYSMTGTEGSWSGDVSTAVGRNAGHYTVRYRYTSDNYEPIEGTVKVEVTCKPLDNAMVSVAEVTYTGQPLTPVVTMADMVEGANGEQVNAITSKDYEVDPQAFTDAGTHNVEVVATGDGNYTGTATGKFRILPAQLLADDPGVQPTQAGQFKYVVSLSADEATYDGDDHKPAVSVKLVTSKPNEAGDGFVWDEEGAAPLDATTDYDVSFLLGDEEATEFVNAGDYSVVVTPKGNFTSDPIVNAFDLKAAPIAPEVTVSGWEYGSYSEKDNAPAVTDNPGGADVTFTYYKQTKPAEGDSPAEFEEQGTPEVPTDAGTYKVVANVPEQGNYQAAQAEAIFTVDKRPVTFTGNSETLAYNGTKQKVEGYTTEGTLVGHTSSRLVHVAEGTTVGDYTGAFADSTAASIKANGVDVTANYEITLVPGALTIQPAAIVAGEDGDGVLADPATNQPATDEQGNTTTLVSVTPPAGDDGNAPAYDGQDHAPQLKDAVTGEKLVEGKDYTIAYYEANPDGTPNLDAPTDASSVGEKVAVVTLDGGNFTGTLYVPATVDKAGQPAPAAEDLVPTGTSAKDATDGSINGVKDTQEYSTDGGKTWTPVPEGATTIEGLPAGEVLVRQQETDTQKAGEPTAVMVGFRLTGTLTWHYGYTYTDDEGNAQQAVVDDTPTQRSKQAKVELLNNGVVFQTIIVDAQGADGANVESATGTYEFKDLPTLVDGKEIGFTVRVFPTVAESAAPDAKQETTRAYAVTVGDNGLDVSMYYTKDAFDAAWTMKVESADTVEGAEPSVIFVKVLSSTEPGGAGSEGYQVVAQQQTGRGTECVLSAGGDGTYNALGAFPVDKSQANGDPIYYKTIVTGFVVDGVYIDCSEAGYVFEGSMSYDEQAEQADKVMATTIEHLPVPLVHLDPNGGELANAFIVGEGYGSTVSADALAAKEPTRANHTFEGWYDAPTGGTKVTQVSDLNEKVTLYAHWNENQPAPEGLSDTRVSGPTATDGSILGVDDTMEYSTDGGETWKPVPDGATSVDGLGVGDVLVRKEASEGKNPGEPATVTIKEKDSITLTDANKPTPVEGLVYNSKAQTLVNAPAGLPVGCTKVQYSLDGTNWTDDLSSGIKAGDYDVHVRYVGDAEHYTTEGEPVRVSIAPKPLSANDVELELNPTSIAYSGKEVGPVVTVTDGTTILTVNEDYTVQGEKAKTLGNHTVTVTGTGNYTGTAEKTFAITPYVVGENDEVVVTFGEGDDVFTYNGFEQSPKAKDVTVTLNGTPLVQGEDYDLVYPTEASVNAGGYKVGVRLKGAYSGESSKGYEIKPKPLTDEDVAVTPETFIYSGSPQGPVVTVNDEGTILAEGTDYTLTGNKATGVGPYTATVQGTGNYTGTVEKTFKIEKYKLSDTDKVEVTFKDDKDTFVYNGEDQHPQVESVTLNGTPIDPQHYDVIFPDESVNADGYPVIINLKEPYEGTTGKGYTIAPKPLTKDDVTLSADEFTYNGKVQQPEVQPAENTGVTENDMKVALPESADAGDYEAVVNGTGNYTGTVKLPYTIGKATVSEDDLADENLPKPNGQGTLTYNGKDQDLVKPPAQLPEGFTKVQYSTDGGETWSDEVPTGKEAGDYEVSVKYVGDLNHNDLPLYEPIPVSILKADQDAPAKPKAVANTSDSVTVTNAEAGAVYELRNAYNEVVAQVTATEDGELTFDGLDACETFIVRAYVPGDDNHNESPAVVSDKVTTPKMDQDAPAAPEASADGPTSVTVSPTVGGQEYVVVPKGATPEQIQAAWDEAAQTSQGGEPLTFDDLTPNTDYEVLTRMPGDDTHNASPASPATSVATPKADQEAPAAPSVKATSPTTVTVNPTDAGQEYSIDGGKTWVKPGEDGTVTFDGLTPATDYQVVSRKAADDTHEASPASPATSVTTPAEQAQGKSDLTVGDANKPTPKEGLEYNGTAQHLLDAPAELPAGCAKIQYSTDGGKTWSDNIPTATDAGTYTVSVKYVGDANHNDARGDDIKVTVSPRQVDAGSGVAPLTDEDGNVIDANGNALAKASDGKYYPLDADGKADTSKPAAEPAPSVMLVGTNPDSPDNVQGQLPSVPDTSKLVDVTTPVYDASEHAPTAYDNAVRDAAGLPAEMTQGKDFTVTYYAMDDIDSLTGLPKAGAKPLNTIDPSADDYAFDAGEVAALVEFTGNHAGTLVAPIKISKRSVHVITQDAKKVYDGAELTAPEPAVWVHGDADVPDNSGLVNGQTVEVTVTGAQTATGKSENTYVIRFKGESEPTEQVTTQGGVTTQGAYTVQGGSSADFGALATQGVGGTFAQLFAMQKAYAADENMGLTADGEEPTAKRKNYEEISETGTLTVTARNAGDDSGIAGDDSGKHISVNPVPTDKAASSKKPAANGTSSATYTGGTVSAPVIFDTSIVDSKGNPKKLVEGTDYTVAYYDENGNLVKNPTDAGTYRMVITYQGDYQGTYETTITIDPAQLSVTTPSATKVYDGKALTNSEGATLDGLVKGQTATLDVTGAQTKVGTSTNTYEIVWDGTAKESNYTVVSEKLGTLEVTAASAESTSSSASKGSTTGTRATTTARGETPKTADELPWQPLAAVAGMSVFAILVAGLRLRRREDGRRAK